MNRQPYLGDIRVLDASRILAGPYCAQVLADLGADVVKVERPGQGDDTRQWGPPFVGSFSAYFLACNRNKRSITLDFHADTDRRIFRQLLARADVLIENYRTDSLESLDLAPTQLLATHPRLIICSISGFGRQGTWSNRPGYDLIIQAMSGMMAISGPAAGPPSKVGVAVADILTGLYASTAILACIHAREHSGHGYHIDLGLLDSAVAAQVNLAQAYLCTGEVPPRQGNAHLQIVPYRPFQCQDGWLVLTVGNDDQWQRLCGVIDRPGWRDSPDYRTNAARVAHRAGLENALESIFLTASRTAWLERLAAARVPATPIWDYAELFRGVGQRDNPLTMTILDPTGKPVDFLKPPWRILPEQQQEFRYPPDLGEHSAAVLQDWLGETAAD